MFLSSYRFISSVVYALTAICLSGNMQSVSATALQALGEPHRVAILDLLRDGEQPVSHLVERLELSQPAVSKHLRVLREAGLVEVRQEAQRRVYSLRLEPLTEIDEWLGRYRALWEQRLDALHTEVARGKRERRSIR